MVTMTNRLRLAQLGGMIRYECLLHWRQRGILVMVISMLVIFMPATIQMGTSNTVAQLHKLGLTDADVLEKIAQGFGLTLWPIIQLILLSLAPMIAADAIAKDQQFGVRDTLN